MNDEEKHEYEIFIDINIFGFDFDPDILSERVDVKPDYCLRRGQYKKDGDIVRPRYNWWSIKSSPQYKDAKFYEHWDNLKSRFGGNMDKFIEICKEYKSYVLVRFKKDEYRSHAGLDGDFIKFLAELNIDECIVEAWQEGDDTDDDED